MGQGIQNNLAIAYSDRVRGDRAENIEQAIRHCQFALQIRTIEAYPAEWAATQNNLASAYNDRVRGDRAENIEQAIRHYQLALGVRTKEAYPASWAETQTNLGMVYNARIRNDRAENIEQAIEHCQFALQFYTKEAYPASWAEAQNNLAIAYKNRIRGDRAENIEKAIEHCQLALQVLTKEAYPASWARTQHNLAVDYSERIRGNRAENIKQAIKYYRLALQVYTKEALNFVKISSNLGRCYLEGSMWEEACQVYSEAEKVGENTVALAAGEEVQAKYLAEIHNAYRYHAFALAQLGQYESALKVLEKGKARRLNQAVFLQKIRSALEPQIREKFTSLQQEIFSLEQRLKISSRKEETGQYTGIVQELRRREKELSKLLPPLESVEDEDMSMNRVFEKCRSLRAAFVAINVTPKGAHLLVASPNQPGFKSIFLEEVTRDNLAHLTWGESGNQSPSAGWVNLLPQTEEDWPSWSKELPGMLIRLGEWLWPKLDQFLQKEKIQRVILVPQGELFLYPLHATPFVPLNEANKGKQEPIYPLERYTISYTPSLRLYDELSQVATMPLMDRKVLFVEDPDGNLRFSFAGQESLSRHMRSRHLTPVFLHKTEITVDNVLKHMKDAALVHYFGHGSYNWLNPEASGLKMYSPDGQMTLLTMSRIAQTMVASQVKLVILSACQTGMTDIAHTHWQDQFVGLPAGFLRAGAKTLVGSLWSVKNKHTQLLFSRFYKELFSGKKDMSPSEALRQAQLWFLQATPEQIKSEETVLLSAVSAEEGKLNLSITADYRYYPAYWAAFFILGNGFTAIQSSPGDAASIQQLRR